MSGAVPAFISAAQVGGIGLDDAFSAIVGSSPAITQAKEVAMRVAASDSTVLLQGESSTGKEMFAKAIHQAGRRGKGPFVSVNCAAIPEQLLESELFGYEEGAFTGARKGGKRGLFEAADKGTLFLDEIGDMSAHLQAKLLRVLQEKQVARVGGAGQAIDVDVRIIAATHRDLGQLVAAGAFRADLYYRLHVIPIHLPSLRERREDILALANGFLRECGKRLGKELLGSRSTALHKRGSLRLAARHANLFGLACDLCYHVSSNTIFFTGGRIDT